MESSFWLYVMPLIYVLNLVFSGFVIFNRRKSPTSTWAWLLLLFFLPILGFILYILVGRNLQKNKFVRWQAIHGEQIQSIFQQQLHMIQQKNYTFPNAITDKNAQLIHMNLVNNHAFFSAANEVKLFTDGNEKFAAVIDDILAAKHHIHVQYYIYKMDEVGTAIYEALVKKAKEGVKVRVIYDDLGSRKLRNKHFRELIDAGGEVAAFFPSFVKILNPRINFRNHRKLVIVDGVVGYIGGFNVGKEYASLDEKIGYWHDIHLRIVGESIYSIQAHFLFDWQQANGQQHATYNDAIYFPPQHVTDILPIQIVSSGPDTDFESIKDSYIRMILSAKKYVYIESPYFVPDDAFLSALTIAASSGVDVRVITPAQPDHPFVYGANSAYGGDLLHYGGRVFRYEKGFLHGKMMVVDDELVTIGTTNIDVRSFSLNFEINAILFDKDFAVQCRQLFEHNISLSREITNDIYEKRPLWTKIREAFSRLLAPLL